MGRTLSRLLDVWSRNISRYSRIKSAYVQTNLFYAAHDFFTHQPVQNAAVFLLRVITHDWADDFVTRILLQLRHAATPTTKLVMVDYILPLACEDDGEEAWVVKTLAPPGSGLLPNLGKASANAFWLDMTASSSITVKFSHSDNQDI